MSECIVYGLTDPRTGEIRYVGQSRNGLSRPKQHAMPGMVRYSARTHKGKWISKLLSEGQMYGIQILEEVGSADDLDAVECFWIAQLAGMGLRLTNSTKGGRGCVLYRRTAEHNRKISEAQRGDRAFWHGKQMPEETRIKMSRAHGGRPVQDSLGRTYVTVAEAARQTGIGEDNLRAHLRGRTKSVGGGQGKRRCGLTFHYIEGK